MSESHTDSSVTRPDVCASASTCSTASECVCMYVRVWVKLSKPTVSLCVRYVCRPYVCVPEIFPLICVHQYAWMCVCVCVCVCAQLSLAKFKTLSVRVNTGLLRCVSNALLPDSDTNCPGCHSANESFSQHKHTHTHTHTHTTHKHTRSRTITQVHTQYVLANISTGSDDTLIATCLTPFTF